MHERTMSTPGALLRTGLSAVWHACAHADTEKCSFFHLQPFLPAQASQWAQHACLPAQKRRASSCKNTA